MATGFRKMSEYIKAGDLELVKSKLSALPLEIRSSWKEGYDLISFSIRCGYLEAAKLLINLGLQIREWEKNNNILNLAVRYGDLELIKLLEEKDISIVSYQECGYDPFYCLAYRTNFGPEAERILDYFLLKGLNPVTPYDGKYTLLHLAAEEGNHQLISSILSRNPQLNFKHKSGLSPLHLAAMHGHSEVVSLLLSVQHGLQYSLKDESGRTPLLLAAMKGDIRTVSILLQRTMIAYKKNKSKMENISSKERILLLYCASMVGDKKIFEMLRKKDVNINEYLPETGKTPLHIAIDANQEQIVRLLLQDGADVNAKQKKIEQEVDSIFPTFMGYTPLHIAVEVQNSRLVKLLLHYKASVTACDVYDQNPLHLAARNGCLEVVNELLNSDCIINSMFTKSKVRGWTPLHAAVVKGHLKIVELFMKKGVNPNTMTDSLLTPLLIVAHTGNEKMAQLLLSYNANPKKAGGTFRQEAICEAASMGSLGVVKLLYDICSIGPNKVKYDYFGLYNSAYVGHVEVVEFYLEKGADPNALANPIFLPPLYAAASQGHDKIVEMLLNAGAKCDLITETTSG